MAQKMLVTNFNFSLSAEEFKKTVAGLAPEFAKVPGCVWKIWLIDEASKEAGAVYLFKDDEALQTFKASELVANVLAHPALSNFDLKERDILTEISTVTRAPIGKMQEAYS